MPFANNRAPTRIANTAPITCPSPKQIVHGLALCSRLSELHIVSDIRGVQLAVLLKWSVSSYLWQILGTCQVTGLGWQGLEVSWCYKSTAMMY